VTFDRTDVVIPTPYPRWLQHGAFAMLLLMLGGLYVFPTRTALHTWLYVLFFLPAIVFLLSEIFRRAITLSLLDWLMLAFIGSFAVSAFYPGVIVDDRHWLFVVTMLVAFFAISRLSQVLDDRQVPLFKTLVVIVAISCLIQNFIYTVYAEHGFEYRICCMMSLKSSLYEAQAIGFYLSLAIFAALTSIGRWRVLFLLAALIMFSFGFQTFSRSFFVAMTFFAGWMLLGHLRSRAQILALITAVLALVLISSLLVLQDRGFSRADIWGEAFKLILQRPLFGYGSGYAVNIHILYQNDPSHWISQRKWQDSHNIFLTLWLLYGAPSLLAFVALATAALRAGWRYRHDVMMQVFCAALVFGIASLCFEGGPIFGKLNSKWPAIWFPLFFISARWHVLRRSVTMQRVAVQRVEAT
jgi:O-antigen ligase